MLPSLVAFILSALLALVPAAAASTAATAPDGILRVSSLTAGEDTLVSIFVASADPVARVTITAPPDYVFDLQEAPGTRLGDVSVVLADVAGSTSTFADGALVVAEPASVASDPAAQACAPGTHDAVWRATLSVLGQRFDLPIFVDSGEAAGTTLRFCPIWHSATIQGGVTAHQLSIFLVDVLEKPTNPGRYTWSGLVSPPLPTLAADESKTFEVRSTELVPHVLTLRARHDAKKKIVVLSGTLTAVGEPQGGVEVSFVSTTDSLTEDSAFFGPVKTNAAGEFTVRRSIAQSTQYSAFADVPASPCAPPTTAPAGCVRESVAAPPSVSALVRVRRATDPKLVVRRVDQAHARRSTLTPSDFPAGWEAYDSFSIFTCRGFSPKLGALTATGEFESRSFVTESGAAWSKATIYASEEQARTAYARESDLGLARCLANEIRAADFEIRQLGAIPFPRLGQQTRAVRLVYSDSNVVVNLDLVSFHKGRAVVHLGFAGIGLPLPIEEALAKKVAARARRG